MNLTIMIYGSCDYLSLNAVNFAFEIPSHSSLWTFGIPLEQKIVTKMEKVNKQANLSIINKCKFNYITRGYNWVKPKWKL